ncbi:hypothetical protein [Parasporobacterium paucivorans]|uniref:Uncharacterized protein n=1 Tax=Parasporobacterium paucivorans DSM 15970 TaxID=1122934 RepID=A0A1M6AYE0_9FIRM|nr:hypothetical protein [Parasporobacterium paucivorans]SHI41529.1 hypothetical protein SAMN02745691_00214 [Parasporobacterium paucivorans DSM 15970]
MIKLWNGSQVDLLEQVNPLFGGRIIPREVIAAAKETIGILDEYYGSDRDPEEDLGGYVCICEQGIISESEEYKSLLAKYGTSVEMAEFTEPILVPKNKAEQSGRECQWYRQLFILSSDFAVTMIYKDVVS